MRSDEQVSSSSSASFISKEVECQCVKVLIWDYVHNWVWGTAFSNFAPSLHLWEALPIYNWKIRSLLQRTREICTFFSCWDERWLCNLFRAFLTSYFMYYRLYLPTQCQYDSPKSWQPEMSPDITNCPLGSKIVPCWNPVILSKLWLFNELSSDHITYLLYLFIYF